MPLIVRKKAGKECCMCCVLYKFRGGWCPRQSRNVPRGPWTVPTGSAAQCLWKGAVFSSNVMARGCCWVTSCLVIWSDASWSVWPWNKNVLPPRAPPQASPCPGQACWMRSLHLKRALPSWVFQLHYKFQGAPPNACAQGTQRVIIWHCINSAT